MHTRTPTHSNKILEGERWGEGERGGEEEKGYNYHAQVDLIEFGDACDAAAFDDP